jgi:hypothetical protein
LSEFLPTPDPGILAATQPRPEEIETLDSGTVFTRIHDLEGPRPSQWSQFRYWGPTRSRFDHHPEPSTHHPDRGVMYLTTGTDALTTALAEKFQDPNSQRMGPVNRVVRRPTATVFATIESLTLLDLRSGWITRAGGNQAIMTGPRPPAQEWARAIYAAYPDIHGVVYGSSIWGPGTCVAVWERGLHAIPTAPLVSRSLLDPYLDLPVRNAVAALGTVFAFYG